MTYADCSLADTSGAIDTYAVSVESGDPVDALLREVRSLVRPRREGGVKRTADDIGISNGFLQDLLKGRRFPSRETRGLLVAFVAARRDVASAGESSSNAERNKEAEALLTITAASKHHFALYGITNAQLTEEEAEAMTGELVNLFARWRATRRARETSRAPTGSEDG